MLRRVLPEVAPIVLKVLIAASAARSSRESAGMPLTLPSPALP